MKQLIETTDEIRVKNILKKIYLPSLATNKSRQQKVTVQH